MSEQLGGVEVERKSPLEKVWSALDYGWAGEPPFPFRRGVGPALTIFFYLSLPLPN